jgi:ribosomal protein L37AE/L43A
MPANVKFTCPYCGTQWHVPRIVEHMKSCPDCHLYADGSGRGTTRPLPPTGGNFVSNEWVRRGQS